MKLFSMMETTILISTLHHQPESQNVRKSEKNFGQILKEIFIFSHQESRRSSKR